MNNKLTDLWESSHIVDKTALSQSPKILITESSIPRRAAAVAAPMRKLCPLKTE